MWIMRLGNPVKYILYNNDLYKAKDLKKIDKRNYGQDDFWKIFDKSGRLRTVKCDEESLYQCDIDFIKRGDLMFDRENFEKDFCGRYSDWLRGYIGEEDKYLCWCREGIICTYEDKEEDECCEGCNHKDGID